MVNSRVSVNKWVKMGGIFVGAGGLLLEFNFTEFQEMMGLSGCFSEPSG